MKVKGPRNFWQPRGVTVVALVQLGGRKHVLVRPPPVKVSPLRIHPSFLCGFPGGAAQAPAEGRRTTASTPAPRTKRMVSGGAGNENIPTTGGDGGWRHTLLAKEGNSLTPHRPAATHVSMTMMETALKDGKHLQQPGSRASPCRGQEVGDAWMKKYGLASQPPQRKVLLRSARGKSSRTELTPGPRSTGGTPTYT